VVVVQGWGACGIAGTTVCGNAGAGPRTAGTSRGIGNLGVKNKESSKKKESVSTGFLLELPRSALENKKRFAKIVFV